MSTSIADSLTAAGIPHRLARFDAESSPEDAAAAIGLPPEAVCVTVAIASLPAVVLVVLPSQAGLDLETLRGHLGENRSVPINSVALERMTGFAEDAVTPLPRPGLRQFRVVLDAGVMSLPEIAVGGGEVGLAVVLSPEDFLAAVEGEIAAISETA
tara:strand:- start:937 stop:1404 length:468 start_codon:yes stop_codon:yes gene_type:complete